MPKTMKRPFVVYAVHVVALSAFAVAQPLYDLLGGSAEFFVAHGAGAGMILALVLTLSLAIPAVLVLLEACVGWLLGHRSQQIVHWSFVGMLVTLIVLPPLDRAGVMREGELLAAATMAGVIAAVGYARLHTLRRLVTVAALAVPLFPAYFVLFTPVRLLVLPRGQSPVLSAHIENAVPIVLVIFDEFNPTVLLHAKGKIDEVRFPNFATLAREGWWFPNATAAHPTTRRGVPALLTGRQASTGAQLPILAEHPHNLFTWLAGSYDMNVIEPLTRLCPEDACRRGATEARAVDLPVFLSDVVTVYMHVVLPRRYAQLWLPPLDEDWKAFGGAPAAEELIPEREPTLRQNLEAAIVRGRGEELLDFVDNLRLENHSLNVMHVLLPHKPYENLPSGRRYYYSSSVDGLRPDGTYPDSELLVRTVYQKYMYQVGFVDRALGRLINKLKTSDRYDDTLLIITADHGVAIMQNQTHRDLSRDTASRILRVPLFIKTPGATRGGVNDKLVTTLDVVPTIADILGAKLDYEVDGRSVFDPFYPDPEAIEIHDYPKVGQVFRLDRSAISDEPHLAWQLEAFGSGLPLERTVPRGPHQGLVGMPVSKLHISDRSDDVEALTVESDMLRLFDDVRLGEDGILPVVWQGRLLPPDKDPVDLAVVLNGQIVSTTTTFEVGDVGRHFVAFVPEGGLRSGANDVGLLAIEVVRGELAVRPIATELALDVRIVQEADGGPLALQSTSGLRIPVQQRPVTGHLQHAEQNERRVVLQGWAADVVDRTPVEKVLVFRNGSLVYSGITGRRSAGLARAHESEALSFSGFRFELERSELDLDKDSLRIFAVAGGVAGEVMVSLNAETVAR